MTDKNGARIFKGDILAFVGYNENEIIDGVVKYGIFNCGCCYGVYGWYIGDGDIGMLDSDNNKTLFVRGNIYDNPELIAEDAERLGGIETETEVEDGTV